MSRLFIFCEVPTGGAFLAAQAHFNECKSENRTCYFVASQFSPVIKTTDRTILLEFPNSIFNLFANIRFLHAIKQIKIRREDVIFSHGIRSGFLISISVLKRVNLMIHRHINKKISLMYKLLLLLSNIFFLKIYAVSPPEIFKNKINFYPLLSPLIRNQETSGLKPRTSPQLPKNQIKLLWLSRLEYPKKPLELLKALELIDPNLYSITFVGKGEYRSKIEDSICKNRVNGQIFDEVNVFDALNSHDAVVLLSDFEGVPFVLQEAMFMNKLVLCSDLPGNRFLGANSFIYLDSQNIVQEISKLLDKNLYHHYQKSVFYQWSSIRNSLNYSYKELA